MERKVLGRGLEVLIPQESVDTREKVQMLQVTRITPSPFQPRTIFSQEKIEELANSIREKGVIQPLVVRNTADGNFELVAGERRLRAAKLLGWNEVPAIVRRVPDADVLEMSIIENIQREELNPIEEAKAYRRLTQEFGLTQESIAQRVGKDKSSVSNLLRILNLPEKIQNYLEKNFISFGHAKALLSVSDAKKQLSLCEQTAKKGFSVRQLEAAVSARHTGNKTRAEKPLTRDVLVRDMEEKLQTKLGTKVRIHHGKKRGTIEIDYYSLEDLERVLGLLGAH